jgi:hypothetical protein
MVLYPSVQQAGNQERVWLVERGSILVTSNLPFSEWKQIFQGELMDDAPVLEVCRLFALTRIIQIAPDKGTSGDV